MNLTSFPCRADELGDLIALPHEELSGMYAMPDVGPADAKDGQRAGNVGQPFPAGQVLAGVGS